jgi:hypothetical protein
MYWIIQIKIPDRQESDANKYTEHMSEVKANRLMIKKKCVYKYKNIKAKHMSRDTPEEMNRIKEKPSISV